MTGEGRRFNEGKARYDLLHPDAIKGLVGVLTHGANKYGDRNWEEGMLWSKVIPSLKRHLAAIENGIDYDEEDHLLHVDHLQANAHFLSAYYRIYPQGDDRVQKYAKMPKIGLDIDDVICDFIPTFREKFDLPEATSWSWSYKLDDAFQYLADNKEEATEFYLNIPRKVNPIDIPFEPHCYITSRSIPSEEITNAWLESNGFPCSPVYTVPTGASKVEVAKNAGVEIFVDDKFDNFVELNNAGIFCYLFDAPHNQRYDVGHRRIYKLSDILNRQ